jgi:hypothetical protein
MAPDQSALLDQGQWDMGALVVLAKASGSFGGGHRTNGEDAKDISIGERRLLSGTRVIPLG